MKLLKTITIGFLLFLPKHASVFAESYRVVSNYDDVNGIYEYCCTTNTVNKLDPPAQYGDVDMPVYRKAGTDYYLGYRGCGTKWVIVNLTDGPTDESISFGGGDHTFAFGNLTDSRWPPRTGWSARHQAPEDSPEVIPVYNIDITTVGNGSVRRNPSEAPYDDATQVTLTADADLGWAFSQWGGDLSGSDKTITLTMDADKTITATFVGLADYDLLVSTIGSGSVTLDPPGGTYYDGTQVTLTATPDNAYWQFSQWGGDLSGTSNAATITTDADKNITATFIRVDSDGDSISDQVEDQGPNGGDGNNDGTPDRLQTNVLCLRTHDGLHQVTLESAAGTSLSSCLSTANPHPTDCPQWVQFPYGFFQFTIKGITPGGSTTLTLHLPDTPDAAQPDTYYKYGPLLADAAHQWYRFRYENRAQVGARFNGRTITLHFIDGAMGDDDLTANGMVQDDGGPGIIINSGGGTGGRPTPNKSPGSGASGGLGGGCFLQSTWPTW